jgi:two-component system KDP operon response regulator KdpE
MKVLVIDDEAPMRKLLRLRLTSEGYELLEASNGRLALDLFSKKPGLVVLDLGLPDIDGFELLRMIRSRDESVPIVVLSSHGGEDHKVRAPELGAVAAQSLRSQHNCLTVRQPSWGTEG